MELSIFLNSSLRLSIELKLDIQYAINPSVQDAQISHKCVKVIKV